ncbi:MAG: hypothetical protein QW761_00300 [Candidatus Aenigmatarchaeota archaeon]
MSKLTEAVVKLLDAGMSPELVAQKIGAELDGKIIWLPGYCAICDNDIDVYYEDASDPREAAEEYASAYLPENKTYWCNVLTRRIGYDTESRAEVYDDLFCSVKIDPEEPPCVEGAEHDWCAPIEVVGGIKENPGCWGHGGGVIMKMVCRHCRTYKIIDTWATDPATGRQGLKTVEYEPPDERSLAWTPSNT